MTTCNPSIWNLNSIMIVTWQCLCDSLWDEFRSVREILQSLRSSSECHNTVSWASCSCLQRRMTSMHHNIMHGFIIISFVCHYRLLLLAYYTHVHMYVYYTDSKLDSLLPLPGMPYSHRYTVTSLSTQVFILCCSNSSNI